MRRLSVVLACAMALALGAACAPGDPVLILAPVCQPEASQRCHCSATLVGAQTCAADGQRWLACQCDSDAASAPSRPISTTPPDPQLRRDSLDAFVADAQVMP